MWILLSLGAAMAWGADYAIAEQILKKISIFTYLAAELVLGGLCMFVIALLGKLPVVKNDILTLQSDPKLFRLVGIEVVLYAVGNILICFAISKSNASWASLLEISYPLFVILFSWILFRSMHLTTSVVVGGTLMLLGVGIISYYNH